MHSQNTVNETDTVYKNKNKKKNQHFEYMYKIIML